MKLLLVLTLVASSLAAFCIEGRYQHSFGDGVQPAQNIDIAIKSVSRIKKDGVVNEYSVKDVKVGDMA